MYKEVHKPAVELEADELVRCYKLALRLRQMYAIAGEPWNKKNKLAEMKDTPEMEYCLKKLKKNIVAYVSFVANDTIFDLPCLYIWELHVDNKYQRQGLASQLIDVVKQIAQDAQKTIFLRCFSFNYSAIQFYKSQGFKVYTKNEEPGSIYFYFQLGKRALITHLSEKNGLEPEKEKEVKNEQGTEEEKEVKNGQETEKEKKVKN